MPVPKCTNCGAPLAHAIYEWFQKLPFCAKCWKEYLRDFRAAQPTDLE